MLILPELLKRSFGRGAYLLFTGAAQFLVCDSECYGSMILNKGFVFGKSFGKPIHILAIRFHLQKQNRNQTLARRHAPYEVFEKRIVCQSVAANSAGYSFKLRRPFVARFHRGPQCFISLCQSLKFSEKTLLIQGSCNCGNRLCSGDLLFNERLYVSTLLRVRRHLGLLHRCGRTGDDLRPTIHGGKVGTRECTRQKKPRHQIRQKETACREI